MLFNNYIYNLNKLLIIIFPFILVTGSFLPDLACTFIGLTFFLYCWKIKNFKEYKNYIFFFFLVIYIYLNINSFFSFNPTISFETSLTYVRIILFIAALSFFFKKDKKLKYYVFYSFFLCFLIIFIDSLFQFFSGYNLLGYPIIQNRLSSFFGSKLILGSFLTRLLPYIFALIFLLKLKKKKLIVLLILLITGMLVIMSKERLAFVYYCLFILYYFFFNFNKKIIFEYIIVAILFSILIYIYKPTTFDRFFLHTYKQYKQTNNILSLSYRHQTHFETAYKMFLDNKLLGHGLKSFRYLCDDAKYSVSERIINDSTFSAEADGRFYIINDNFSEVDGVFYILKSDSTYFSELIEISDDIKKIFYNFNSNEIDPPKSHIIIVKNKTIVSNVKFNYYNKNFIFYASPGEYVYKGQKLFSGPEYLNGCNTHPHNIYLQFLSELGLLGFFFFSLFFIYILWKLIYFSIKNFTKNLTDIEKSKTFILFGLFLSMIPILPSGNYFNNWLLIITYLPIGFYLSLCKFTK